MFSDLNLKIKYTTGNSNLVKEFYQPVLKKSIKYDRAVGYFTSSIFLSYIDSLREFYYNNGKMRLIFSPKLNSDDLEAIKSSFNTTDSEIDLISRKLIELFNSVEPDSSDIFLHLIQLGILEVKVAVPINETGIFHEKIGIFYDKDSNQIIAINGSNNETEGSLYNHESFMSYRSWYPDESKYVNLITEDFNNYWNNCYPNLKIIDLTKESFNGIFKSYCSDREISAIIPKPVDVAPDLGLDFVPYDYQAKAAELLIEKEKGILEFATGSGKTKTAIYYMELTKQIEKNIFIILVPDKTLVNQWANELENYFDNVIKLYSDNPNWKAEVVRASNFFKVKPNNSTVIVGLINSVFKSDGDSTLLRVFRNNENIVMIADECHNLSTELIMNQIPEWKRRVGLSATPTSEDPKPIEMRMLDYFGGIIASYSLSDAIKDNKLCKYNYYPIIVELNEDEKIKYDKLSHRMLKIKIQLDKKFDNQLYKQMELLAFERARIIYGAEAKISKLEEIIKSRPDIVDYLLVYCGSSSTFHDSSSSSFEDEILGLSQIEKVNLLLHEMGIMATKYTSQENHLERKNALSAFKDGIVSTLTAIKCLDEGVDIPEIKTAIILASTGSKREHIQRRGRVLRKHGNKEIVNIYDMVVRNFDDLDSSLNMNETKRIIEFAKDANNKNEVLKNNSDFIERLNLNGRERN